MPPLPTLLLQSFRQAARALAILGVLMLTFQVHLHPAAGDTAEDSGHGMEWCLGEGFPTQDAPEGLDAVDGEDCHGHQVMAEATGNLGLRLGGIMPRRLTAPHPASIPDGIAFPPEPPPILRS